MSMSVTIAMTMEPPVMLAAKATLIITVHSAASVVYMVMAIAVVIESPVIPAAIWVAYYHIASGTEAMSIEPPVIPAAIAMAIIAVYLAAPAMSMSMTIAMRVGPAVMPATMAMPSITMRLSMGSICVWAPSPSAVYAPVFPCAVIRLQARWPQRGRHHEHH